MSEVISTLYTTPYYTFGSPRYNCLRNYETIIVPENYAGFDALNGTCDKFFPCYSLTSSPLPKTQLVDAKGVMHEQTGSFAFRLHSKRKDFKIIGRKDSPASPFNTTLARYKVYLDKYFTTKLNPGWCVIQTQNKPPATPDGKVTYIPQFVVRALGNNSSIKQLYAIDLDSETDSKLYTSSTSFLPGEIVKYKNHLFKCIKDTTDYPPKQAKDDEHWQYLNFERNVFNADLFALTDTNATYFLPVSDDKRHFDPLRDENDTLVCWSVAYYHAN